MTSLEDYWTEAVQEVFCKIDLFKLIPSDKWEEIGKNLAVWSEHQYMTFGHGCIPNHAEEENKKLQKQLEFIRNHDCVWISSGSTAYMSGGSDEYFYCLHCSRTKTVRS